MVLEKLARKQAKKYYEIQTKNRQDVESHNKLKWDIVN